MAKPVLIVAGCLALGLLLTCILLPMHFSYVSIHNLGLKRNTINKKVDLDRAFPRGRYGWGIARRPLLFGDAWRLMSFRRAGAGESPMQRGPLEVFSDNGAIFIDVTLYLRVTQGLLPELYRNYRENFESKLMEQAVDALRGAAGKFSVDDYQRRRTDVEEAFYKAIADKFKESGYVEVRRDMFFLGMIGLPRSVRERRVDSFENDEQVITDGFKVKAAAARLETEGTLTDLNNQATIVRTQASSSARVLVAEARSQAKALQQTETGVRVKTMITDLELTDADVIGSFLRYNSQLNDEGLMNRTTVLDAVSATEPNVLF